MIKKFNPLKLAAVAVLIGFVVALGLVDGKLSDLWNWKYIAASFFMGFGIAVDVVSATIGRFRHFSQPRNAFIWAGRNTVTHTLFPIMGVVLGVLVAHWIPLMKVIIGWGGAYLVYLLLKEENMGLAGLEDEDEEEAGLPGWLAWIKPYLTPAWVSVFAVSIDALLSGPAKSVQTEGWSDLQVMVSFPIVGLVVGGFALSASVIAVVLHKRITTVTRGSVRGIALMSIGLLYVETCVIGYFGWLAAIRYGMFQEDVSWLIPAGCSLVATTVFYAVMWRKMVDTQVAAATEDATEAALED